MQYRYRLAPLAVVLLAFVLTGCASFYQDDFDTLENVQAAESTKIPLTQAVSIAEQTAKGTPIEIRIRTRPAGPYYMVKLIEGDATNYVALDARSGSILDVDRDRHLARWLKRRNRSARLQIQYADLSLSDAITKAELIAKGRAIEMSVDNERYPQFYEIKSIRNGKFSTTKLDFDTK